jgi:hypothetical protein
VLVAALVLEIVVRGVDDAGVRLAVVGVDDQVDSADLFLGDPVQDGAAILDLNVVEGAGEGDVVLVQPHHLAEVPVEPGARSTGSGVGSGTAQLIRQ